MKYNNYDRKTLIRIIKKRKDLDYQSLFNHCFVMLRSIVADQQSKKNFDYDEALADFNDCVNQAEWTSELIKPQARKGARSQARKAWQRINNDYIMGY